MSLYLKWHIGLGDAVLCNGMVRSLIEKHPEIILPAWKHNVETIREMFHDLEGVSVQEVDLDSMLDFGMGKECMRLGYYCHGSSLGFDPKKFDQEFYRQAEIPFHSRWTKCKVIVPQEYWTYPNFGEPHAFVHQDVERGFHIDMKHVMSEIVITPDKKVSFFRNIGLIQGAKEVHCIDSSLLCLADSLPPVEGQKLFLHDYARRTVYPTLHKDWTILK